VPATLASASPGECFDAQFDAEEDAIVFRRLAREEFAAILLTFSFFASPDIAEAFRKESAPY
jgi:hypothetical protein